jgi:hypothetical protein
MRTEHNNLEIKTCSLHLRMNTFSVVKFAVCVTTSTLRWFWKTVGSVRVFLFSCKKHVAGSPSLRITSKSKTYVVMSTFAPDDCREHHCVSVHCIMLLETVPLLLPPMQVCLKCAQCSVDMVSSFDYWTRSGLKFSILFSLLPCPSFVCNPCGLHCPSQSRAGNRLYSIPFIWSKGPCLYRDTAAFSEEESLLGSRKSVQGSKLATEAN